MRPTQRELFKRVCEAQDDNGQKCNRPMSKREFDQDGMCSRCADLIWSNYAQPLMNNKETTPIVFARDTET